MSAAVLRLAAWPAAALVGMLGLAAAALAWRNGGDPSGQIGFVLPFLTMAPVAGLLAARVPGNPMGWLLVVVSGHMAAYAFTREYATYALVTSPGSLPLAEFVTWLRVPMWIPAAVTTLVVIPAVFPSGRPLSRAWSTPIWIAAMAAAVMIVVDLAVAWPLRGTTLLHPDDAWVRGTLAESVTALGFTVLNVCAVAALVSALVRYRRGSDVERHQLRWLLAAVTAFVVGLWTSSLLPDGPWSGLVVVTVVTAIPVSIAVAVLRYRLYDIDRIISRTASYAALSAVLVGVYAVGVLGIGARVSSQRSDLVVAGSTLVAAALFRPLHGRIQGAFDRRFDRSRYDATLLIEGFGRRLRGGIALDEVRAELQRTAREALRPRVVSTWLPS